MLWRLGRARAEGNYRGGDDCFEDGIPTMDATIDVPPMPANIAELEVLPEAIIRGKIVGMKPGFFRGRGVGLYEIEVLEVLKGVERVGAASSVFLFWPETRLDVGGACVDWSLGGWVAPPPQVGREILLTPPPGVLETFADRLAIVAWNGAEAIYEVDGRLSAMLSPAHFPEVFAARWLATPSEDAFLWLDHDENGVVTDGSELFGSATVMPNGHLAENGWVALSIYDVGRYGGNNDGVISADDEIWPSLRLWRDLDRNGASGAGEVATPDDFEIVSIALHHARNHQVDEQGNLHAFRGTYWARRSGRGVGVRPGLIEDIAFVIR